MVTVLGDELDSDQCPPTSSRFLVICLRFLFSPFSASLLWSMLLWALASSFCFSFRWFSSWTITSPDSYEDKINVNRSIITTEPSHYQIPRRQNTRQQIHHNNWIITSPDSYEDKINVNRSIITTEPSRHQIPRRQNTRQQIHHNNWIITSPDSYEDKINVNRSIITTQRIT